MDKKKLIELYDKRNESSSEAILVVESLERYLLEVGFNFLDVKLDVIKKYINGMIESNKNSLSSLIALARYFYVINNKEIYIYFTKILGGIGVIENIKKKMIKYAGEEITNEVFKDIVLPPLGTSLKVLPTFTNDLMTKIKNNLQPSLYNKILAGNNHGLSKDGVSLEKEFYKNSKSFDDYLKERHQRKVDELQSYCDNNTVWFEQIITQDVVDYVKSNQEILSGVRKGDKLYVTKIPYDTNQLLSTDDKIEKSYYACHCPFARETIIDKKNLVTGEWCYCSAGFAKFPFEVILDCELEVKVLENALDGHSICRFEIDIKDKY